MAKFMIQCSWNECPHLDPATIADMLLALPPHQRDARSAGIPALGSGAIYPVAESEFLVDPFEIPVHWRRGYAMDVGWNRTCALWGAHDDQSDTTYFYSEHYRGQAEPSVHAEAVKSRGDLLGVIDPASRGRSQKDGEQLFEIYRELGLRVSPAQNGVESGIFEFYQRLSTGRIKVFRTCQNFISEYRLYRRDDKGRVVKENDHLMDCGRYFIVSGLAIASLPSSFRDSITKKGTHEVNYNPLDPKYVSGNSSSTYGMGQHKMDYKFNRN